MICCWHTLTPTTPGRIVGPPHPKPTMNLSDPISEHFIWFDYLHSDTAAKLGVDLSNPPDDIVENIKQVNAKEEEARAILGVPLSNSCCWRPLIVNQALKSSDTSAHVLALGVDMLPHGLAVEDAFNKLADHPTFMATVDQLIIERGCVHMGLAVPAHNTIPRCELRGEAYDPDGTRHYPLLRVWKVQS